MPDGGSLRDIGEGDCTIKRMSLRIAPLRTQGRSWREISRELGLGKGSVQRAFHSLPKNTSFGTA